MNPRLTATAALCREITMPSLVLACIFASGYAGIDTIGATPIADRLARSLPADAGFADKLQSPKLQSPKLQSPKLQSFTLQPSTLPTAEHATVEQPVQQASAIETTSSVSASAVSPQEPVAATTIVTAALTDTAEVLPPETTTAKQEAPAIIATRESDFSPPPSLNETPDGCTTEPTCIDRYLWALYQHTPKEDAVTVTERRQVTVKKKGALVTVTKTYSKVADEDFGWKDPDAAAKAGMSVADYVIGGMDRDFKLRLFQLLRAAEAAGMSPGITSAFRDDYRQSIASGLKAANNRSYHGGSLRGGYGHGLAADIVSVSGATRAERLVSSDNFWKWVDTHGKEFGIGRPYLGRDPPHVAPSDGEEYAKHRPNVKSRQAGTPAKPGKKPVGRA